LSSSSSFPSSSPERTRFDECCAVNTGFCVQADHHIFAIPLLDLSVRSSSRHNIDGYINTPEYAPNVELPMFNGGKNGKTGSPLEQNNRIGTAYIAYDCNANIVCAAAFFG
jgi:hypothetical protein